jgi:hypothetical protein
MSKEDTMTKELEEARTRLEKVAAGERLSAVYWLPGKAVRPDFVADLRRLLSAPNGEVVAWIVGDGPGSIMTRSASWAEEKRLSGLPVQPLYAHTGGGDE